MHKTIFHYFTLYMFSFVLILFQKVKIGIIHSYFWLSVRVVVKDSEYIKKKVFFQKLNIFPYPFLAELPFVCVIKSTILLLFRHLKQAYFIAGLLLIYMQPSKFYWRIQIILFHVVLLLILENILWHLLHSTSIRTHIRMGASSL